MALFQSSSPSYLLLCSLDGCMRYLKEQNGRLDSWFYSVKKARERLFALKHLRLYTGEGEYRYDCSKICILTDRAGITGYQLYDLLYEQGIVCELAGYNLLVAMTGAADNEETLEPLVRALLSIDCCLSKGELSPLPEVKSLPRTAVPAVECFAHPVERLPLSSCVGRICGEMVYLYPPGIPMLLPGEVITEELTALIAFYGEKGVSVNGFEEGLLVLTNP
jgi:arginine/lysine/ornithine decarboxylase